MEKERERESERERGIRGGEKGDKGEGILLVNPVLLTPLARLTRLCTMMGCLFCANISVVVKHISCSENITERETSDGKLTEKMITCSRKGN